MFKLPEFPAVDFTKFDLDALRNFELPDAVRDTAYLTVGLGVAAVEQAQARRRELVTTISHGLEAGKIHLDTVVDKIEAILPEKAAALFGQAREITDAARNQVIELIRSAA